MKVTQQEIKDIFKKLDEELHELQSTNNVETLIQISADFKDIKEVIQYFESSLDTVKTQNESLKETLKETIREMLNVKERMLDGIITRDELKIELDKITKKLEKQKPGTLLKSFKSKIDSMISPKMVVISITLILFIIMFMFNPTLTKEIIHEIKPVISVGK